jgi:hypothetical protein
LGNGATARQRNHQEPGSLGGGVASTLELLRQIAPDLQQQVQKNLTGFMGAILRSYLPQVWVFRTEQDSATLRVGQQGEVGVFPALPESPDVTITTSHAKLSAALTTRDRSKVPPGPVDVQAHTSKGRTAFDFTRQRLGL